MATTDKDMKIMLDQTETMPINTDEQAKAYIEANAQRDLEHTRQCIGIFFMHKWEKGLSLPTNCTMDQQQAHALREGKKLFKAGERFRAS